MKTPDTDADRCCAAHGSGIPACIESFQPARGAEMMDKISEAAFAEEAWRVAWAVHEIRPCAFLARANYSRATAAPAAQQKLNDLFMDWRRYGGTMVWFTPPGHTSAHKMN